MAMSKHSTSSQEQFRTPTGRIATSLGRPFCEWILPRPLIHAAGFNLALAIRGLASTRERLFSTDWYPFIRRNIVSCLTMIKDVHND